MKKYGSKESLRDQEDEEGNVETPQAVVPHVGDVEAVTELVDVGKESPAHDEQEDGDQQVIALARASEGREDAFLEPVAELV